jgi:hypothetical protein
MKKLIVLLGGLLTVLALGACGGETIADRAYFYDGVVLDSATLNPLDSIVVSFGDTLSPSAVALTDSVGEYEFALFGKFPEITFRRVGYKTRILATSFNGLRDSMIVLLAK